MRCKCCGRKGNRKTLIQDTDDEMICQKCWWDKINN